MIYLLCICMAFCAEKRIFYAIGGKRAPSKALFSFFTQKVLCKIYNIRWLKLYESMKSHYL